MRNLFFSLGIILFLTACNSELSFSEISKKQANKEVQSFIEEIKNENGAHLFFDKQKRIYVYLNEKNAIQGEKAVFLTDFDVEVEGDSLKIVYSTDETTDYSNQSLDHERLYQVDLDKKYDNIKVLKNGKEDSFSVISGN